jgi:hypothetical protein
MSRLSGAVFGGVTGALVGLGLWVFVGVALSANIVIALVCCGLGALVGSRLGADEEGADETFGAVEQMTERRN